MINLTDERLKAYVELTDIRDGDLYTIQEMARQLLASRQRKPIGYVDMFALMDVFKGESRFCSLRPEPNKISCVSVFLGDSVAVPKLKRKDA